MDCAKLRSALFATGRGFRCAGIGIGRTAKFSGGVISAQLAKVNPDVFRELAWVSSNVYTLLMPRREQIVDRGDDGRLPVVLVHGLGSNRGTWTPLRAFLRLHGHRRLYAFGYEAGSIEEHGRNLAAFIDEVLAATGAAKVDLVAHSLGGIVSRYALQRAGAANKVRQLITLASPHGGTYAAFYANTLLTRSLRPESEIIADLNRDDLTAVPWKFTAVYSDRDVYVVPKEMMTHPAAENIFVPDISHTQHLAAPVVLREVLLKLSDGEIRMHTPEGAPVLG